jgi:pimeloyl-ACP methyl ester carboxylesterase
MLNGRYDAAAMAPKIEIPALFVLAENDNVIPVENGAALARAWGGPQRTVTLAGAPLRHRAAPGVLERRDRLLAGDRFASDASRSLRQPVSARR